MSLRGMWRLRISREARMPRLEEHFLGLENGMPRPTVYAI